ncbi:amino acid permease-domain-containing protein [Russula earlei]|uniref:Amino acid permease-domain-containing protein n=1 Tax=Russula earlei TaxID=71964 RepID=A0ACC0TVM0_9AGAM|nr:amino acid permease-domain-containing protein [Russula earlei]
MPADTKSDDLALRPDASCDKPALVAVIPRDHCVLIPGPVPGPVTQHDLPRATETVTPTKDSVACDDTDSSSHWRRDVVPPEEGDLAAAPVSLGRGLPSFAQSEFYTIVRRQRRQRDSEGLEMKVPHSRVPHLNAEWEFSGWGSMRYLDITPEDRRDAGTRLSAPRDSEVLGYLSAISVSGNDVSGSVFYAFPLVFAAAGIYSPFCLLTASLLLLVFRPLLLELASTVRINGSNYVYLLQFSGKMLALVGAAATLLDAVATSTVSAATASAYLVAEIRSMPISTTSLTVLFLIALGILALAGIRESASATAAVFVFHMIVMAALMVASIVHWATKDPHSTILKQNWASRPGTSLETVHALFYGVCIAFLGVTGFECTPSYIEVIRPKDYSSILRNLILISAFLNTMLSFLASALLPLSSIIDRQNVLSALGSLTGGGWLHILVLIDAVSVLLGGVLTGTVTTIELLERMAQDRILPHWFSLRLPVTGSLHIATLFSSGLSLLLYVGSGMSLLTVSYVFSIAFLSQMLLFAVSSLLLKLKRPRLSRPPHAGMFTLIMAFLVVIVTWAGNIVLAPIALGVFSGFFLAVLATLLVIGAQPTFLRLFLFFCSAGPFSGWAMTAGWQRRLVMWYKSRRAARVCVWLKDDDIHVMLRALLSVQKNAPDAGTVVFIHAYGSIDTIPSELHPNARLLDEAFPTITVDLAFVSGNFSPALVELTSRTLSVPCSRMCLISLDRDHPWELAEYGGVRVIV